MKMTYSLGKRLLALVVTMALVLSFMPSVALTANAAITTADMVKYSKVVDPYTIHNWKQYFGPDVMSTEYTGGVWSDKSVFNSFADYLTAEGVTSFDGPNGSAVSNAVMEMLATDSANFLVTMSAITANKSISGSSSAPMDTMLVLDVSGSMQGDDAIAVVQATNQAIKTLLDQNVNNRIGVVLYSGNHERGNSQTSTASVLLPLGRYTTTNTMAVAGSTIPAYLTISGSGDSQTVSVASSVDNGSAADSKTVRGGTYIQNGLYQAWQQFNAVTDTKVPEGQVQAGAQRTPVVILMSDGAPTAGTTSYNNVGQSNLGDGTNTTDRIGFMTQLTAAYVRGKITTKYGTTPKFYTLGVGTGNDSVATSVLNPAGSNTTLTGYWSKFDNGTDGQNVQIVSNNNGGPGGNNGWSVYKDAAVAGKNYVDQYWLTDSADGLINAFKQIVNTIVLESERYSTLVDVEDGADLSGYVTFEDELGQLMEVKAVKGIVIGENIFTGAELAKGMTSGVLGTVDGPTEAGHELVRTVKERMGITETTVAQQLIDNAFNAKQLNYVNETEYSNYIGWYADENGKYVGFWQESDGYDADNAPDGAKYINKSYGYLGEPLTKDGAGSDMMHVVVMVHTEIATGHQSVVYKIPAALLPTVTYNVELNGQDVTDVKSITREGADPMRLLFEVGLRSDINAVNLEQKVAEHIEKGGHIHENQDGTYSFYTNSWGSGDGSHEVNYDEPLTHLVTEAHFHPALENDRYYHVIDDTVYSDQNGTVYNGASAPTGTGYYFARPYYEVADGTAKQTIKYAPLGATSAAEAVKGDNGWYIPAGTPHQLTRFATTKTQNPTDTLNYSWNPVLLHDDAGYNSYTFLGNNGTFTVAPAQGISLHKTVTEEVAGAPDTFTFYVTLGQAVANPIITDENGNELANVAQVNDNVITLTIKKDQTIVISGLPTGVTYTVAEEATTYYSATIENATGTVAANIVTKVEATNAPKVYNDLIVSKDVLYPSWMTDISALEAKEFTVRVNVTGADANTTYTTSVAGTTLQTDGNGSGTVTFTLKDGQSATVNKLPAGANYFVAELSVPAGFTANATESAPITGTVPADSAAVAGVTNDYAPVNAEITVTMTGTKSFLTSDGSPVPDGDWTENFVVELYKLDMATGNETLIETATATATDKTWSVDVPLVFDKTGTYTYRIVEKAGTDEHIVYDGTNGIFRIVVTDNGSGTLIASAPQAVEGTVTVSGNTVDKDFVNYKDAGSVSIPVQKIVGGDSNNIPVNDFTFGLYDANGKLIDTVVGDGSFVFAGYASDFATAKQYTIKEIIPTAANGIVGVTYDTAEYAVKVSWDNTNDKLVYTMTKGGAVADTAVFTNTYDAGTTSTPAVKLEGNKTMTGGRTAFVSGESYTIELYKTGAGFVASGNPVDTDVVSGSDYAYAFKDLTFKEEGTYYYVVKEKAGTQGGVTYDTTEYRVTIHVTKQMENNKAVLKATHTVVKFGTADTVAENALNFTNTYKITGTAAVTIHGVKKLDGRELIAGEFRFGLYENGNLVGEAVKNATNGKFTFPTITYTEPGTHNYTVKEIAPAEKLGGVTYSAEEYIVKVEVTDNGVGGLNVAETITKGTETISSYDDLVITNTYTAQPVSKTISATKTWRNTDTGANKTVPAGNFSFTLYSSDATYTTEEAGVTFVNDANGEVTFDKTYDTVGTHYYILRENIGEDTTVSYDAGRFLIQDVVTDDGKGQLHVMRTVVKDGVGEVDEIAFNNLYTPEASAPFAITGMKTLTGRKLEDGEFTFGLYQNGELLQEVKNDGNTFAFDAVSYEKSGTYTYTVKEQAPVKKGESYKGVTYDYTEYQVTVTVTDENGKLKVTSSHAPSQLIFKNTYEIAETPKTGDADNIVLYASMMALSALGFVAMLVLRKKEEYTN